MRVDSLSTQFTEGVSDIHDMLDPEDFVGYDHVTVRVMGQVYDAMPDIQEGATPNAKRKLEVARQAIDEVEEAVEALMTDVWTCCWRKPTSSACPCRVCTTACVGASEAQRSGSSRRRV